MDTKHVRKQFCAITIAVIMVASTFTFVGAFTFPNFIPQAEAQGLQLRVSPAAFPQFENHFFGAQIVQAIIDDPGATDPDESTVSLLVNAFISPRVHLSDGLWYSYFAEDQGFCILLDVLTDGVQNSNIAISKAANDAGSPLPALAGTAGCAGFTVTTGQDTFIAEIEQEGNFLFIEVNQEDLFPTLPQPFFHNAVTEAASTVLNFDLTIGTADEDADANDSCTAAQGGLSADPGAVNTAGQQGDADCDWPFIKLIGIEELSIVAVQAGSASVSLVFDDFAASITNTLDRTTDYPLNAEVINAFTDFMWNINPVEEDTTFFVLNRNSGAVKEILIDPTTGEDGFPEEIFTVFASSPGMEFDERQILELDSEGVGVLSFAFFFDSDGDQADTNGDGSDIERVGFVAGQPAPLLVAANARTVGTFLDLDDDPVIPMFEGDPNVSIFDNTVEAEGGRATVFTAVNDRVASFDYFDIIASAPMTTHDGFTSVDREVYDSADRAVFTVTDPDQNLRSKISEEPDGRESKSFVAIGKPFPLANNPSFTNFFGKITLPTTSATVFDTLGTDAGILEADFFITTSTADVDAATSRGSRIFLDIAPAGGAPNGVGDFGNTNTAGTSPIFSYVAETLSDIVPPTFNSPVLPTTVAGGSNTIGLDFTTKGIAAGSGNPVSGLIINSEVTLADLNSFETISAVNRDVASGVTTTPALAFAMDPFTRAVSAYRGASTGAFAGTITSGAIAGAAAGNYDILFPRYNLLQIDLVKVITQIEPVTLAQFDNILVQVEATDESGATSATARRVLCDFTIADAEDTDGDAFFSTGFLGTSKSGVCSFRVIDLMNVNWDGDTNGSIFDPDGVGTGVGDADDLTNTTAPNTPPKITVSIVFINEVGGNGINSAADEPVEVITSQRADIALVDIMGIGLAVPPPAAGKGLDDIELRAFSNMIYRLELDEEGSNSSIFTGRMDFQSVNQLDKSLSTLQSLVLTGDPLKAFLPNRFIPPNRLAFGHTDVDIVTIFRPVSATFIYETRDGSLEWDRASFSFGQDAFLTITDEDLNKRPDATERFNLPTAGFIFFELGKVRVDDTCAPQGNQITSDCIFDFIDATLLETGSNTGTFVAQVTMSSQLRTRTEGLDKIFGNGDDAIIKTTTQQRDLEANYIDVRDRSSVKQEFDDILNIRTTLGDVVLDKSAYPPGAIMYVEIHDNDFNTDVDVRETIDLRQVVITTGTATTPGPSGWGTVIEGNLIAGSAGTCITFTAFLDATCGGATAAEGAAPIAEITIFKSGVGRLVTLLPAGLLDLGSSGINTGTAGTFDNRFGTGVLTAADTNKKSILPMLDRSGNPVQSATETGPNTGIFEFEVRLPGPKSDKQAFPITLPSILTTGEVKLPVIDANLPIQVTYEDFADESGETEDEEELATFLFNTARLRTDRLEYGLGQPVDIIIEEPDFNVDSRSIDEIAFTVLDVITDKFDTEEEGAKPGDFAEILDQVAILRTNLTVFRESGFNTGVFVVQLEELVETFVDRGEFVELIYADQTPSGGGAEIRIEYEFLVVEILPEIIFDKEEYTPFDEFIVSIISPDSNQDPDRIETIKPLISSSSASIGRQSLPETGPNTGIFEEDFDLTPDKSRFPGELKAVREDGVTVEFRIDEDTVATKSVFINYHVGQTMFDKDAFRISERGVLRVIDPDANRNPDTIDTTNVRFWSTTDRGGLSVVLRETGDRTGIFEEIITFTPDEESTGTRLRVSEGDTITAKYTDNTLPAPAALDTAEVFTVEIEELFASALIGAIVPPLERAVASEPELVDSQGMAITDVTAGSQVLIQSEITNSQTKKQPFAYIVQIKDADGVTISLSWVTGELPAKESLKAAQSWIPDAAGDFTVEIFVWESVDNPVALSPVRTTTVSVS